MKLPLLLLFFTVFTLSFATVSLRNQAIYEISARPWLYELSKKYSRPMTSLDHVPNEEIQHIADMNIDAIYLMGVWQLGEYGLHHDRTQPHLIESFKRLLPDFTLDDVIGSPYAVVNYTANTALGGEGALKRFRSRISHYGLRLILDFVPNHLAADSIFARNPQYFVTCPRGWECPRSEYLESGIAYGKDPYSGAWTDTAQLNYWNPETIKLQIQNLLVAASYADGLRVDMAMLLLNDIIEQTWGNHLNALGFDRPTKEFWEIAIKEVKRHYPDCLFLAEQYWHLEERLLSLGFDSVYDKDGLYEHLKSGHLDNLRKLIFARGSSMVNYAHFVENHDEERACVAFGSCERSLGAALVSFTLPGLKFHHHGQHEGKRNRLAVHLRRSASEPINNDVYLFYKNFLELDLSIFKIGEFTPLECHGTSDSWRLMAWKWQRGTELVLVVVNYSEVKAGAKVHIGHVDGETIEFTEQLSGGKYLWSGDDVRSGQFTAVVDQYSAQIFRVQSI
ncbi:hypothetical protein P9112_008692 [Eukaryota sp. TZLM1-RC]